MTKKKETKADPKTKKTEKKPFHKPVCSTKFVTTGAVDKDPELAAQVLPYLWGESTLHIIARGQALAPIVKYKQWSKGKNASANLEEYVSRVLRITWGFFRNIADVWAAYQAADKHSKEKMLQLSDQVLIILCRKYKGKKQMSTSQIEAFLSLNRPEGWTPRTTHAYVRRVLNIVRDDNVHHVTLTNREILYDLHVLKWYDAKGLVDSVDRDVHDGKVRRFEKVLVNYGGGL